MALPPPVGLKVTPRAVAPLPGEPAEPESPPSVRRLVVQRHIAELRARTGAVEF